MANRVTFSDEYLDIVEIWDWYDTSRLSLEEYKEKIKSHTISDNSKFRSFSMGELDVYFQNQIYELECLTSLSLLSAVEATLRMDYLCRVSEKRKDALSRSFREIHKLKENKASLEDDILECWKKNYNDNKRIISDFISALKYRHWLAHGRYWTPKYGKKYDAFTVYMISEAVLKLLNQ